LQQRLGARIVRYADDIMVLCRKGSEQPMAVLQQILERMGLPLNKEQTRDRKTGNTRFTERDLYAKYGPYKVPTTAGWTRAHALR
jgi:hypothetical protein